ncbi:hypothetical protein Y032_0447g1614 [Ancylostoma ceylanicum]|uniref:Uncharacterized protein n=1 Tax=Ancylostoma ceylanicum TaxID=53326 RepID=A0A016WYD9_9BILA|nr:hypothetical protein Y032_0447g1614 [Ancylostoma ceylanicum]
MRHLPKKEHQQESKASPGLFRLLFKRFYKQLKEETSLKYSTFSPVPKFIYRCHKPHAVQHRRKRRSKESRNKTYDHHRETLAFLRQVQPKYTRLTIRPLKKQPSEHLFRPRSRNK